MKRSIVWFEPSWNRCRVTRISHFTHAILSSNFQLRHMLLGFPLAIKYQACTVGIGFGVVLPCCRFNQSFQSIVVMMFAMDGYSFLSAYCWLYTQVLRKKAARICSIPVSPRATSAMIHSACSLQEGVQKTYERYWKRWNYDNRSLKFSRQSVILYFGWCLILDLMLSWIGIPPYRLVG